VKEVLRDAGVGLVRPVEPTPYEPASLARLRAVRKSRERPVVLVVEDDPDDRQFIEWAFRECEHAVDLRVEESGEDALELLTLGRPRPRPAVILLDLTLPGRGGLATLRDLRRDLSLRTIPVIVFTGSDADQDITRCYELGANSYFTKPCTLEGYRNIIRILETYWLQRAELPRSG